MYAFVSFNTDMYMLYTKEASFVFIWVGNEYVCTNENLHVETKSKAELFEEVVLGKMTVKVEREGLESKEFWSEYERGF